MGRQHIAKNKIVTALTADPLGTFDFEDEAIVQSWDQPRSTGDSMPSVGRATGPDSIAGYETPELGNFAHDHIGGTNVHPHRSKFCEGPRKRFRLEPKPPGDQ